jgi:hypothetical protein
VLLSRSEHLRGPHFANLWYRLMNLNLISNSLSDASEQPLVVGLRVAMVTTPNYYTVDLVPPVVMATEQQFLCVVTLMSVVPLWFVARSGNRNFT